MKTNQAELANKLSDKIRTILIVDDEDIVATMLERLLQGEGHNTISRSDGFKALEVLETTQVDILITDLRMPGMDGVELVNKARVLHENLDIIVITGYGTMDQFLEALSGGVVDFILKPIDREQLLRTVNRILEKKNLADSLVERTKQLVNAEKMATIGLLSTGVAHEINNPTTFIRTNLQLMKEYIKRMQPKFDNISEPKNAESIRNIFLEEFPQMIEEALTGTDRIQKIVSGIKHYAHMGEDSYDENVDIREVIAQSVSLVRAKLRKHITITENYLNISEIKGHFSKLEQVFVNLLVNAADAINEKMERMRKDGVSPADCAGVIDVSATIIEGAGGENSSDYLVLTFFDNGGGISEEKMNKVFDPFFTTKPVGVGTGLGLYISYEIITQHGGEISVQSEPGEGTAFVIKLPVQGSKESGSAKKTPATQETEG
ncbi:histidine kinase [hydrothermal vent metagenome]|uniref:Histidine kinase n=1 Tax=hydrothermal vent metagenome TaxID=652676 RepID=A0A3B1CFV0_9ZZZZ